MIDADYAQACQNKTTDERAEDEKCSEEGRSSGHYGWYFLPMGSSGSSSSRALPAVGARLAGGVTSIPAEATAKSGIPSKGATSVSRGGFRWQRQRRQHWRLTGKTLTDTSDQLHRDPRKGGLTQISSSHQRIRTSYGPQLPHRPLTSVPGADCTRRGPGRSGHIYPGS